MARGISFALGTCTLRYYRSSCGAKTQLFGTTYYSIQTCINIKVRHNGYCSTEYLFLLLLQQEIGIRHPNPFVSDSIALLVLRRVHTSM